jgi:hypothetical protein
VYKLFRGEGTEQDLAAAGHSTNARYVLCLVDTFDFQSVCNSCSLVFLETKCILTVCPMNSMRSFT